MNSARENVLVELAQAEPPFSTVRAIAVGGAIVAMALIPPDRDALDPPSLRDNGFASAASP